MSEREMQEAEKQAEGRAWRHWENEAWGNTESGAHVHGWIAGRDWARLSHVDKLAAAQEREAAAKRWAALWKRSAKRDWKAHINLLVALCQQQEAMNDALTERDELRRRVEGLAGELYAAQQEIAALKRVRGDSDG